MRISEVELEERARRLEGRALRAVKYQGAWTRERAGVRAAALGEVHSITHAVHLELEGIKIELVSADELGIVHGLGLSIHERKVLDPAYGAIVDVSDDPGWKRLVGSAASRAMIHWDDIFERLRGSLSIGISIHADYLRRRDFPVTLELAFPAGSAFISAARLAEGGVAHPLAPELVVFFSEKTGQALGLR